MKITNTTLLNLGYTDKYVSKIKTGNHYKEYYLCVNKVNGKQRYEHVLLYETLVGAIPNGYIIHHIDGNGLNNDIENLQCVSRAEHTMIHGKKICIDGVYYTLDQVMNLFNFNDKGNCIRALSRVMKTGKPYITSKFYGHEVSYE